MKEKSLVKNTLYNALYNGLNILFPLISIPYLSRVLMADGLGVVNYARNIVNWFALFASLGIPRYGIREIAKCKTNKRKLNSTFSELFLFNLISTIICVIIYLLFINNIKYFNDRIVLYYVTGIQLFLNIFNVDWLYQGLEEYGYITKRSFVVKLFSLVVMFLFVRTKEHYIIYALIQSIAVAGNSLFNFFNLRKFIKFSFIGCNLKKHIAPIFVLLSTQLAVSIYAMLDITMLGFWCDDTIIGYYSNVHKIINVIAVITASLGSVMLPRLVDYYQKGELGNLKALSGKALELIIGLCLPISIGLFMIAPEIVCIVFGESFTPCIETLRVFAPFVIITTVGNLFGTQLLMTFNKEKKLLLSVSIGSVINIILNSILIPVMQQNGAALASVVTELIVLIAQIYIVGKTLKVQLPKSFIKSTLLINVVLSIYLIVIQMIITNVYLNLLISILGSMFLYLSLGILLNNFAICYLYDLFIKRITSRLIH